jgi:hypothetical protein
LLSLSFLEAIFLCPCSLWTPFKKEVTEDPADWHLICGGANILETFRSVPVIPTRDYCRHILD